MLETGNSSIPQVFQPTNNTEKLLTYMINLKTLAILLSTFTLVGCGGGSSSSNTSTNSSDSTAVGTSDAAAPAALPTGTEISFNPEIVFDGELSVGSPVTARYSNNSSTSSLPAGNNDSVSVTMTIVDGGIQVSFTHAGQSVELILTGFKDYGAGYVEEFTVETKVNGTSLGKQQGRFVGSVKPKNSKASKLVDTNGAPTEAEFQKYITGKFLKHAGDDPDDNDGGYEVFKSDGTVESWELDGTKDEETATYEYSYNGGDPRLYLEEIETINGKKITSKEVIKLTFNNFYEGTYKVLEKTENGVPDLDDVGGSGTWVIFNSVN